ncbi:CheR family methyltransferase [Salinilacihabitans rarus]|uniref:CheR family methyltransferase n=1 Tax=Salinilacihabitans rarus TaxID=2961596 RepID=UPI0020C92F03|nr:protein-glutamate O-methyltransferase CheR [Salinilacihabitans rarus]
MSDDAFERVLAYVESEMGFATSHYNDSYLDRRVTSRMRRTDTPSYEAYLELLREDPDEREALLGALSINVTGFFRNPDVWAGIREVMRDLSAANESVHVWSAACADGREPYSLSMLAHDDPEIDETSVHVLATDISEPALETARSGVYEESRTVDLRDQLAFLDDPERYVERDDRRYHVSRAVRRNVTFERHDLINDEPRAGFDLVICRNLFIYIDADYKRSMLDTISQSLLPGGYLVIGKAETIPPETGSEFEIHDSRLRIYRRDPDARRRRR